MRQTVKQYMASVAAITPGVQHQVDAYPYPQAAKSHLAIWMADSRHNPYMLPADRLRVRLVNSDHPGVLLRIADGEPMPTETAAALAAI